MLWAEADGVTPSGNVIAYMVSQLGTVAALMWYLYYVTSKELPKARGDYTTAIDRVVASTTTSIDAARRDYIAALEQQRTRYAEIIQRVDSRYQSIEEEVQKVSQATWDLADAVRAALDLRRPARPSTETGSLPGSLPHSPK
jgi:hypothetical protein